MARRGLMWRLAAVSLSLAAWLVPASAAHAVDVSGTLQGDTTWTVAGGPYVLTGDLTVPAGVTSRSSPARS